MDPLLILHGYTIIRVLDNIKIMGEDLYFKEDYKFPQESRNVTYSNMIFAIHIMFVFIWIP
jgi:hypothetical protein